MLTRLILSVFVILIFGISIFADNYDYQDIVDSAVSAGNFNTFVSALKAAGLVETLRNNGPFTLFAPTDDAFARLPDGTVEDLLKAENKDRLVAILNNHVVAGSYTSDMLVKGDILETVNSQNIDIKQVDKGVKVNESHIITTDVLARNGIVHVIDKVLIPEEESTASLSECDFIRLAQIHGCPVFSKEKSAKKVSDKSPAIRNL